MSELLKSTFIINTAVKDANPSPKAPSSVSSSDGRIDVDLANVVVMKVSVNPDTEETETSTSLGSFEKEINAVVQKALLAEGFATMITSIENNITALNRNVTSLSTSKQPTFAIDAGDYGAKGDLVYREITYNTVQITRGTDTTTNIQAALDTAGKLVPQDVNLPYESAIRVIIPAGKYIVTKTLVVPSNIILDCEHAVFFNFLSDDWAPIISGKRYSHATRIKVHANRKSGIEWGDRTGGGVRCNSYINSVWVEHAGVEFEPTLSPNRQKCGLRLFGLSFRIERIEIRGGNIGLDIHRASNVLCPSVSLAACFMACRIESADHIILPCVALDTNSNTGFQVDNSGNVFIVLTAFVDSDRHGTAMDEILRIGASSTILCENIHITAVAISTGGRILTLSNCIDSTFNLVASNARLSSQTSGNGQARSHWDAVNWSPTGSTEVIGGGLLAHDMGVNYQPYGNEGSPVAVVRYGANLGGVIKVDLLGSEGARTVGGEVYGLLTVNGQVPPRATQTLIASSIVQVGNSRIIPITSNAAVTLSSASPIARGVEGQVIYLSNVGNFNITLTVAGVVLAIAAKRVAPLIFVNGAWMIAR